MKRLVLILFLSILTPFSSAYADKNVLGWVEPIILEPGGLKLRAKLDSGAKTSSIRAKIIREYQKDNESWITYEVSRGKSKSIILDSKVERWVRIKKKDVNAGFIRRPVVKLGFCLDNKLIIGEVNLSPRSGFLYPVLVGRNMLKKHVLIDSHKTLTTQPNCNGQEF